MSSENKDVSRRNMLKWTGALAGAVIVGAAGGFGADLLLRPNVETTKTETATKTTTTTQATTATQTTTKTETATKTTTATQTTTATTTVTAPPPTISYKPPLSPEVQ